MNRFLGLSMSLAMSFAMACTSATGDEPTYDESEADAASDGGGTAPDPGACEGPLGKPVDPAKLAGCCTTFPA